MLEVGNSESILMEIQEAWRRSRGKPQSKMARKNYNRQQKKKRQLQHTVPQRISNQGALVAFIKLVRLCASKELDNSFLKHEKSLFFSLHLSLSLFFFICSFHRIYSTFTLTHRHTYTHILGVHKIRRLVLKALWAATGVAKERVPQTHCCSLQLSQFDAAGCNHEITLSLLSYTGAAGQKKSHVRARFGTVRWWDRIFKVIAISGLTRSVVQTLAVAGAVRERLWVRFFSFPGSIFVWLWRKFSNTETTS